MQKKKRKKVIYREAYIPRLRRGKMSSSYSLSKTNDLGLGSQDAPILNREELDSEINAADIDLIKLSLSVGITKSLGNYEFLRVDAACEHYCEKESRVETWKFLEQELGKKVKEVISNLTNSNTNLKPVPNSSSYEIRLNQQKKRLNDLILLLSDKKLLDRNSAIQKLKEESDKIDINFCEQLIKQLQSNNFSYFKEEQIEFSDAFDSLDY